ncbi:glycoside hydrolase family 35 protein [Paenibacillus lemnae]|uniref:beta-galactosidase n=1 Tax=Paenibacillus lemnae TaxID=1330551 RepID=A0A848M1F0_PAELE|nr:beta-galactosidase [Paenibacillus lemnae]NMO94585.1 beta-galactosidase [Paenibacillus lemnae]
MTHYKKLEVIDGDYHWDGKPFQILSGALHYFRVVPEYWEDRLLKLKACGLNTVETYLPWNLHEPEEGKFCFEGMADVERFVTLAGEMGLHVILRPSPYICAEWEFGGLPAWLLREPGLQLRCSDPAYLAKVDRYYDELIPRLVPLLSTNGGPVIAVQIENEYGSFGNDTNYLAYLQKGLVRRGVDVLLFTSDGPTDGMLQGGTIPDVTATVNFGSDAAGAFTMFKTYRPSDPLMCMEFWNGWFDHWRKEHHTRTASSAAEVLEDMLKAGASVNLYMFHGGTNFGFYNGANNQEVYEPTITSYDYDAPLSECGDVTEKYRAFREVIARYRDPKAPPLPDLPSDSVKKNYGKVTMSEQSDLLHHLDHLGASVQSPFTMTMESLGQDYGFIIYSTTLTGPRSENLHIQEVHDRAQVFLDGVYQGCVERWDPQSLPLNIPEGGGRLDLFVENMGRVNYGPRLKDPKGITEGVRLDNQFLYDWTITPLPFKDLSSIPWSEQASLAAARHDRPSMYRGGFEVDETADTFLRLDGWEKGVVWLNGFNLGRYWNAGPQQTLYIPGPLLRKGTNELIILELHHTNKLEIELTDAPDLG